MATQARQRVTLKKLVDGRTLNFVLSPNASTTQVASKDPASYAPDYAQTNLKLTPILNVSGVSGGVNKVQGACRWYENGVAIQNNSMYAIGTTSADGYALTVKQNETAASKMTKLIRCEYDYTDAATGLSTTVTASVTLQQVQNAGTVIMAMITPNDGTVIRTVEGRPQLLHFEASLIRGSETDSSDVSFEWFVSSGNGSYVNAATLPGCTVSGAEPNTGTVSNVTGKTLTLSSDAVVNVADIKVVATDRDTTSSTAGKSVEAHESVVDMTDPYELGVELTNGDSLSESATSTLPATIYVTQGNHGVVSDDFYTGKTLAFYRVNGQGVRDETPWCTSGDFPGWTIGQTAGTDKMLVKRTYSSSAPGTKANRTVNFATKHLSGAATTFEFTLEF